MTEDQSKEDKASSRIVIVFPVKNFVFMYLMLSFAYLTIYSPEEAYNLQLLVNISMGLTLVFYLMGTHRRIQAHLGKGSKNFVQALIIAIFPLFEALISHVYTFMYVVCICGISVFSSLYGAYYGFFASFLSVCAVTMYFLIDTRRYSSKKDGFFSPILDKQYIVVELTPKNL